MTQQPSLNDAHREIRNEIVALAAKRFGLHGFKSVTMDDLARDLGM